MLVVGIDPHMHVHIAVAVDTAGRRVGKPLTVKSDPSQAAALLSWIRRVADGGPVTWAIEDGLARARNLDRLTDLISIAQLPGHVRRAFTDMTTETAGLSQRIRQLDATIAELVSPLAPNLLHVTGISHISAAVLIGEIGDITRFASPAKLARYAGCAPIPVYSADKQRHRLHRGGNRRINSVLYTAAIVQKRFSPEAQNLLARHEPAKGTRGARRILQRHLADIVYRAMTQDQATWQHQVIRNPVAA